MSTYRVHHSGGSQGGRAGTGGLRWELLGSVRAWRGEAEVDLGAPQQRALVGVLLLREGAVTSQDQLISAIWGEEPPPAAAGMIRSYVSRLRRVLGDGTAAVVIESVAGGYALPVTAGTLDLADFQRRVRSAHDARRAGDHETEAAELRAALDLWKGTPLAGVPGGYADNERTRLIELWYAAIEDLAAADLRLGRHAEAGASLASLVIEQPLRERARELLMLALYRAGRKADALALFQETQKLLTDELGLDPGPELREMQRRILASDPSLAAPGPAGPAVTEPTAVAGIRHGGAETIEAPKSLPPDLPEFVGRSGEVRRLAGMLEASDTQVPVVGIAGLPGIGKTTLAVHLGHRLAGEFPDGQFFIDLGAPGDPLAALLRAAGVAVPPESSGERAALWRSLTIGRRSLVVLDDARDVDQVRPLLPGPGGAAVVITAQRRLFGLSHARWTKLDPFSEAEARALLERTLGAERIEAEPGELRRLYELTAGLPQVVHAAGARLASRPDWSLATAVRRLGVRGHDPEWGFEECGMIEGRYESTVRDLPRKQARALRLLAVPRAADLSLAAAAAVLDLAPHQAESLLESLADLHLVETAGERYRFHNPIREYARARAWHEEGEAACHAALARLARFYAATLRDALLATGPGRVVGGPLTGPGRAVGDPVVGSRRAVGGLAVDSRRAAEGTTPAGPEFGSAEAARAWMRDEEENLLEIASQAAGIGDAPARWLADMIGQAGIGELHGRPAR
ncbi:BTAD domain-containing putative transcriptional regulator [Streptosporangium sp. NPDC002721]|uniref:AfsR/SARP family transcriptional regulator n=1 Tax=Streptosporangium sp. NPDC002721 TaxID=3366188 RepID=UPI0036B78900